MDEKQFNLTHNYFFEMFCFQEDSLDSRDSSSLQEMKIYIQDEEHADPASTLSWGLLMGDYNPVGS